MTLLIVFACGWLCCFAIVAGIYLAAIQHEPAVAGRTERPTTTTSPGRTHE